MRTPLLVLLMALALPLAACGGDTTPEAKPSKWVLKQGPAETVSIQSALAVEPGERVAVLGRVQDINRDGFAQFVLYDTSVPYCGEGAQDCGCDTPWDYCCIDIDTQKRSRMPVELRDAQGKLLRGEHLGLRLLDLVALEGTMEHTESGSPLLVVTQGWERRERPTFDDSIKFPQ